MNGTRPETRNHIKNELPFMRPTTPPASPKKNRMTSSPSPACGGAYQTSVLSAHSTATQHRGHDDEPEDGHDEADDELHGDRGGHEQDHQREEPTQQRRPLRLDLELIVHNVKASARAGLRIDALVQRESSAVYS